MNNLLVCFLQIGRLSPQCSLTCTWCTCYSQASISTPSTPQSTWTTGGGTLSSWCSITSSPFPCLYSHTLPGANFHHGRASSLTPSLPLSSMINCEDGLLIQGRKLVSGEGWGSIWVIMAWIWCCVHLPSIAGIFAETLPFQRGKWPIRLLSNTQSTLFSSFLQPGQLSLCNVNSFLCFARLVLSMHTI